ncbi:MAG: hypothetical protein P4L59_19655 [Desulfosporosinus sp.]|nr:hypothetical protein [Desulfosporosinus sp.]
MVGIHEPRITEKRSVVRELDEIDHEKMRRLMVLPVKIAKRLRSEGLTVKEEFKQI